MLISTIELPDGSYVSSGSSQTNTIKSVKLTEVVNSADELTLGSTCAAMVEVSLLTPGGGLDLTAGDEIILYKDDAAAGLHSIVGTFIIEQPTRPTANTMRLIGYDRVTQLDKDLTEWLSGLDGWPYTLLEFAGMVCAACGLELATKSIPNAAYEVTAFTEECTGRQLMQWIGEAAGRFVRATPFGKIELATYAENPNRITAGGPIYYFANGLNAAAYQVPPVDAVQLRLADSEDGYLWPEGGENNYIIQANPILNRVTAGMETVLENIRAQIPSGYTPCTVSIPANMLIDAGDIVTIVDSSGTAIKMLVMQREQAGQRDTLTCTGSANRQSSTVINNSKVSGITVSHAKNIADAAAKAAATAAVEGQTQLDIFNRLFGGQQGFILKNGKVYVSAEVMATGILRSADGTVAIDLSQNTVTINGEQGGKRFSIEMSATGFKGFSENSDGEMEHVLDFDFAGEMPGIVNPSWRENVGLLIAAATGVLTLGTTEAATELFGTMVTIDSPTGDIRLLGKAIAWESAGSGKYRLIGTDID